jgi:Flp pilus assembly protein TadB
VVLVGGPAGPVAGAVAGVATWVGIGRSEPPAARRERDDVRRELPHVVSLLGSALAAGAGAGPAITLVGRSLPGPASARLEPLAARLALGADPAQVWADLARDPELGPLGATLARAHASGTPVVAAVQRLADDLADRARAEVEDRARAVGVRAALPLGLCLLPAFVLIGIVPLVAGLVGELSLG